MPALSFQGEWLDKLLSCSNQQTTRKQTDRIKVGDVVHIYNQQRKKIIDKPLRKLTDDGYGKMVQLAHSDDCRDALIRGLYSTLMGYPCDGCGNDSDVVCYHGRALCSCCIEDECAAGYYEGLVRT